MNEKQIREGITKYPFWFYEFDLNGIKTPIEGSEYYVPNRFIQLRKYFFEKLLRIYGGSLKGKRVLDLGCNSGKWTLECILNGAEVVGIDGNQTNIDQANFVFQVLDIDFRKYKFYVDDAENLDEKKYGKFDIVLCLGLLYHLSNPLRTLETISRMNTETLVVESYLQKFVPLPMFLESLEGRGHSSATVNSMPILTPTRTAIILAMERLGYNTVMLKNDFENNKGMSDYRFGGRKAFIGTKKKIDCIKSSEIEKLNFIERIVLKRVMKWG